MRNERGSTILLALVWMMISTITVMAMTREVGYYRLNVTRDSQMLSVANLVYAGLNNGLRQSKNAGWAPGTYSTQIGQGSATAVVTCNYSPCLQAGMTVTTVTVVANATLPIPGPALYTRATVTRTYHLSYGIDCSQGQFTVPHPCATGNWSYQPGYPPIFTYQGQVSNPPKMPAPWR